MDQHQEEAAKVEVKSRKRVGLALGGGVLRGAAHIGVLKTLEQAGIPIDYVAGTSAGSLVGALYCAGMSVGQIQELAMHFHWWQFVRPVWPARGFLSFHKLGLWLVSLVGDLDIRDLQIPYATVATDMNTGEPVPFREGKLALAVQASCSVPGIMSPIELNGRILGDGSISNNLPVDVLRAMGADYVIGVDIVSASIRPAWGPVGMAVTAIEILIQRAGGGIEKADCLITPRLGGKTYVRLSRRREFILLGEQAAQEKLDLIRSDLSLLLLQERQLMSQAST